MRSPQFKEKLHAEQHFIRTKSFELERGWSIFGNLTHDTDEGNTASNKNE
jgi:hypothetical protein